MDGTKLDTQLCNQCRGRCCQGHPGVWSEPQRFFAIFFAAKVPTAAQLRQLLATTDIELRDLGGVLIPAPKESASGCSAQTGRGCKYSIEERPCQCLALRPYLETLIDDHIHCSLPEEFGSGTARNNWRPFQSLLQSVADNG